MLAIDDTFGGMGAEYMGKYRRSMLILHESISNMRFLLYIYSCYTTRCSGGSGKMFLFFKKKKKKKIKFLQPLARQQKADIGSTENGQPIKV